MFINHKIFVALVALLGLALVGIFGAWLLASRGLISLPEAAKPPESPPLFPASEPLAPTDGSSEPTNDFTPPETALATSTVVDLSPGSSQLAPVLEKANTKPVGALVAAGHSGSPFFIERATGHLYQIANAGEPVRLSNTTIPKVVRAGGGANDNQLNFLVQTENNRQLEQRLISLDRGAASSTTAVFLDGSEGNFLPLTQTPLTEPVIDFAVAPTGDHFAFLAPVGGESGSAVAVRTWDGADREVVLTLPFRQLTLAWPATSTIAIGTKPSAQAAGVLYFYDLKTKKLERVISGVRGLSAVASPDLRFVLYSGSTGGGLFTALYRRENSQVTRLPFSTLAEKCVWAASGERFYCAAPERPLSGELPDDWHQGLVSFSDNLWQYDLDGGQAKLLFNPKIHGRGESLDAVNLTLDANGEALFLTDRNDFSLWRLRLESGFGPARPAGETDA